jgi:hypothetical protein
MGLCKLLGRSLDFALSDWLCRERCIGGLMLAYVYAALCTKTYSMLRD